MNAFCTELASWYSQSPFPQEKRLVFGTGDTSAATLFIGEAPGEQEEAQGLPFVGKAGKNLDELLAIAQIDRQSCYITNVVKFRPTKISPVGRIVNRTPTPAEIAAFTPWLSREIALVSPNCIVTLGNVSLQALLGRGATIGQLHGQITRWNGLSLFPLYHPASLIYNRSLRPVYEDDVRALGAFLRREQA